MIALIVMIGVLNFGLGYVLAAAFGYGPPGWYFLQRFVLGRNCPSAVRRPSGGVQEIVSGLTGPDGSG